MSDRQERDLTPEQERAHEAVRSLPRVEADPAFRERLKADFVAGRLGEAAGPGPRRGGARRRIRMWSTLVPAAVALALVVFMILNGGPAPDVADIAGEGTVTVDGRNFTTSQRGPIAKALKAGSRVEVSDGVKLDLVYGRTMAVQVSSGTATVPAAPARWFGKAVACRVEVGELSLLTGPGFRGGRLVATTGEGTIEVTGTLVSVFRDSSVTCVCVHEGTASVGIDAGDMEPILAGKRKVMFADGSPPLVTDIAPPHRDHMVEFEAKYGDQIRSPR